MTALWFFVAVLATYRVARMLALEEGPGLPIGDKLKRRKGIFKRVREKIDLEQETWVGRGVNCVLCLSFWLAWGMALLLLPSSWPEYILTALGIAGGVVIVHKVIG